jgi:AcrR family transcriptional regulator
LARVTKSAEVRQDELLDIAERLFMERGYDTTPVQAIIDAAGIAKGTFYHHYPSKSALLDGVLGRMTARILGGIQVVLASPGLDAATKFRIAFSRSGQFKTEHRAVLIQMHRALRSEANAALYARMIRESMALLLPIVTGLIQQGVAEGIFHTRYPAQAARIMVEISTAMGNLVGDALLVDGPPRLTVAQLEEEVAAYHDAVHRLLGAAPGTLELYDRAQLRLWLESAATIPVHAGGPS